LIKIIALLDNKIGVGGGFDQALNAIIQMQKLCSNRFDFEVFTTGEGNFPFLNGLDIRTTSVKISIFDRFLSKFSQNNFWQFLQIRLKVIGPLEKKLIEHGCDIVYFVTPGNLCAGLQKLNYINTLWDLCHREKPEFPEVRNFNTFFIREKNYQHNFGPALLTLTDSNRLANMAAHYYGVERDRFLAMPFGHTPFLKQSYAIKKAVVLEKYSLVTDYFYYPAQYWAHKNHIRILQALLILRDEHQLKPNVVFSGKDYGNLAYILKFIESHNLNSQVRILGFVPSEDIRGLYENSMVVVMPTYFGPTNLPPLEAWTTGKPLIYTKEFAEQAGNAALLIDPDSASDLANAMLLCMNIEIRLELIDKGYRRLEEIDIERISAEEKLYKLLLKFTSRRQCWA
jgi:glycosyltransferase involved in cell wall biosynthesis